MAQITIQHGCGHDRVIETPGPDDPEGLLARLAETRGAVHRAPASKCPDCEAGVPRRPHGSESYGEMQARVEREMLMRTPAVAAERDLQPSANSEEDGPLGGGGE